MQTVNTFFLTLFQAETSIDKLKDIDKLTDKIDQYRSDNEHLRYTLDIYPFKHATNLQKMSVKTSWEKSLY